MKRPPETTPAYVCRAVIDALKEHQELAGVRTIKRLAGELSDETALDRLLAKGLPALLVAYFGGKFSPASTNGRRFKHDRNMSVICCAGNFKNDRKRLERDHGLGIEQLLDYATYVKVSVLVKAKGI